MVGQVFNNFSPVASASGSDTEIETSGSLRLFRNGKLKQHNLYSIQHVYVTLLLTINLFLYQIHWHSTAGVPLGGTRKRRANVTNKVGTFFYLRPNWVRLIGAKTYLLGHSGCLLANWWLSMYFEKYLLILLKKCYHNSIGSKMHVRQDSMTATNSWFQQMKIDGYGKFEWHSLENPLFCSYHSWSTWRALSTAGHFPDR